MKILISPYSKKIIDKIEGEYLLFIQSRWDDYGVKTTYSVHYYDINGVKKADFGEVKIISLNDSDYDENGFLTLSGEFDKLPDEFGLLGQSDEFYVRFLKSFNSNSKDILSSINDLSIYYGLRDKFESSSHFKSSLIRFSDAERALKSGQYIINEQPYTGSFSFGFQNGDDGVRTKCNFDFDSNIPTRTRVNVIIGENGTGKTTYLADLALSMSGRENRGEFSPSRPPFSKIIAVSFSSFDTFEIPKEKKSFSYKYCGLRDKDGFMSRSRMLETYKVSCDKILRKNIVHCWLEALSYYFDRDRLNFIENDFFANKIYSNVITDSFLSSGESIILYSFTQIIAEANRDSLILFDEPELHLHPQAISKLIPAINGLLYYLNSYAIIATHSPIILQQIPARYTRVFDKSSGRVQSRTLEIETLGENLDSITSNVFGTIQDEPEYKRILKTLYSRHGIDGTNKIFGNRLSLGAQLYLESLRTDEK